MTTAALLAARYWRALAAVALAALAVWGYLHWRDVQRGVGATVERGVWQQAIAEQKREAAAMLDDARKRVEIAERLAASLKQAQDLNDVRNTQTIAGLRRQLDNVRLRDPHAPAARCGGSGDGAGPQGAPGARAGGNDPAETRGLLSPKFAGMLRNWAEESDTINAAYIASRADAERLRGLLRACQAGQQ